MPSRVTKRPPADPDMPKHLRAPGRALWVGVRRDFLIADAAALALLAAAAESADRCDAARQAIERDGATITDRFAQVKPHPLLTVERDSRAAVVSALKALGLAGLPDASDGNP